MALYSYKIHNLEHVMLKVWLKASIFSVPKLYRMQCQMCNALKLC